MSRRAQWIGIIAGLAWLLVIATLYYVNHKPFSPGLALAAGRAIGQFVIAAAVLALAGGLGRFLLSWLSLPTLAALAVQGACGWGVLALAWLAFGTWFGLSGFLLWGALFAGILVLRQEIKAWLGEWRNLGTVWHASGVFGRAIAVLSGFILGAALLTALSPPLKFDSLVYHLALPQRYLDLGRVAYVPEIMFWGMPQTGEMLYSWAAGLAGLQAAVVLGWGAGLLTLAGVLGTGIALFGPRRAWVAVASLLAGATLSQALAWGYVDWLAALFGLSFLVVFQHWWASGDRRELLVAGILAGMALGSKYTAGVVLLAGLLGVAWRSRQHGWKVVWLNLFLLGSAASLVSLPWWLKNAFATGNPFYPFLFPGGAMDGTRLALYQDGVAWGDWRDFLLLPLQATLSGVEGGPGYGASIGPLLLGLAPLAILRWHQWGDGFRKQLSSLLAFCLAGLLVWIVAGRLSGLLIQSRLYFALFPAFAVFTCAGFAALEQVRIAQIRPGRIASVFIVLVLGFNAVQVVGETIRLGAAGYLTGFVSSSSYRANNLGWYAPVIDQLASLDPDQRVLFLWETRSLECSLRCDPDETLDNWISSLRAAGSPQAVYTRWQEQYTYLLVFGLGGDFVRQEDPRYSAQDWQALDLLLASLPAPQDLSGSYLLYRLRP